MLHANDDWRGGQETKGVPGTGTETATSWCCFSVPYRLCDVCRYGGCKMDLRIRGPTLSDGIPHRWTPRHVCRTSRVTRNTGDEELPPETNIIMMRIFRPYFCPAYVWINSLCTRGARADHGIWTQRPGQIIVWQCDVYAKSRSDYG